MKNNGEMFRIQESAKKSKILQPEKGKVTVTYSVRTLEQETKSVNVYIHVKLNRN